MRPFVDSVAADFPSPITRRVGGWGRRFHANCGDPFYDAGKVMSDLPMWTIWLVIVLGTVLTAIWLGALGYLLLHFGLSII